MKRVKVGQAVRLADPARIAARFYSTQYGGIIGAGFGSPHVIARDTIDGPATVVALSGSGKTAPRGLIEWPSGDGMWLDAEHVTPA